MTREGFLEEVGLTQVSKAQWDGNGVGEGPEEGQGLAVQDAVRRRCPARKEGDGSSKAGRGPWGGGGAQDSI